MKNNFNYIVPIFNKEDILPETLEGIEKSASSESKIVLVVDGCTDRSEAIVDEFIKNSSHKTEKILMPNVHMLLSVNAGLKTVKSGFSIIMQDDIILQDFDTEKKIVDQYKKMKGKLGVISFRYGANIKGTSIIDTIKINKANKIEYKFNLTKIRGHFSRMVETVDMIQGPDDNESFPQAEYGSFNERMCAINGPNVIPWELFSKIGLLDENIAPYGYDDPEYCIRGLKAGFVNGLFPIKYVSEEGWSGSSRSEEFKQKANRIIIRSRIYVWNKHKKFINDYYSEILKK
ncbi:MAG: glycosyltransferase [Bacteroidetes bacterium]|nr:glycosyltransferase [Bacteroidota bacterium]